MRFPCSSAFLVLRFPSKVRIGIPPRCPTAKGRPSHVTGEPPVAPTVTGTPPSPPIDTLRVSSLVPGGISSKNTGIPFIFGPLSAARIMGSRVVLSSPTPVVTGNPLIVTGFPLIKNGNPVPPTNKSGLPVLSDNLFVFDA